MEVLLPAVVRTLTDLLLLFLPPQRQDFLLQDGPVMVLKIPVYRPPRLRCHNLVLLRLPLL